MKKNTNKTSDDETKTPFRHQDYDHIIKEGINKGLMSLLGVLTGIDLQKLKLGATNLPRTLEKRADAVYIVIDENGEKKEVLHLEAEAKNNKNEVTERFYLYSGLLYYEYKLPIRQYLCCLGNQKLTIKNRIQYDNLDYQFTIIELRKIPYRTILDTNTPEGCLLAILGDLGKRPKKQIMREIIDILQENCKNQGKRIELYLQQLLIISNLRNFQSLINEIYIDMAITLDFVDFTKTPWGIEIAEKSKAEGEARGEAKGIDKGIDKGIEAFLLNTNKSVKSIAQDLNVTIERVLAIQKRLIQEGKLPKI